VKANCDHVSHVICLALLRREVYLLIRKLTAIDIDMAAVNLTKAINGAYAGSARRTLGRNTGQPW